MDFWIFRVGLRKWGKRRLVPVFPTSSSSNTRFKKSPYCVDPPSLLRTQSRAGCWRAAHPAGCIHSNCASARRARKWKCRCNLYNGASAFGARKWKCRCNLYNVASARRARKWKYRCNLCTGTSAFCVCSSTCLFSRFASTRCLEHRDLDHQVRARPWLS